MGFRVGLTYDLKTDLTPGPGDPPDLNAEFDHPQTVADLEQAIRDGGHDVVRIGNAEALLAKALDLKRRVDIVFNIAEGYTGRNRESQVPILLEMLKIPCVGADGLTLAMTLDKILTKKILMAEGIPTPGFAEIDNPDKLWSVDLTYPLIVKLRHEGSSKGLTEESLVETPHQLRRQVNRLTETYQHPAMFVEEFIEGQECTVAIIGNDPPEVFPIVQITLDGQVDVGRKFYTFSRIHNGADYFCPAAIPEALAGEIKELALSAYRAVECQDFGRVDFRTDREGRPYVLEINPLPSLSSEDVFTYVARQRRWSYAQVINRILDAACVRCSMVPLGEVPFLSTMPSP